MKYIQPQLVGKTVGIVGLFVILVAILAIYGSKQPVMQPVVAKPLTETISTAALYNDVNTARHNAGAPIVSLNALATQAAEQKCQDMVTNDYYAHASPITGDIGYVYTENLIPGGTWFNENLNEGNLPTNQAWVDSWLNSPDHKATMLDPRFTDTGLAICHRPSSPVGYITVVQEFVQIPAQSSAAPVQYTEPSSTRVTCVTTHSVAISSLTTCN